jgi:hypothetical protein
MKIPFRQGIVTSQTSAGIPDFIVKHRSTNYLTLYINHQSTLFTVANGVYNYLYEEANTVENAWGPFNTNTPSTIYYLYWDIDMLTGIRTFGHITLPPVASLYPPTSDKLAVDLHWFDLSTNKMKVYGDYGWEEKLRVFAGEFSNGSVIHYRFESQVGLNNEVFVGFVLYDENTEPLTRKDGSFITTETHLHTTRSLINPVKFGSNIMFAQAKEDIPEYSAVYYYDKHNIAVASHDNTLYAPAVGFIRTEVYNGELANVVSAGYVTNVDWNFNKPPASPLYLGLHGTIQTTPPKVGFIQKIGTIVSADTILISIDPPIILSDNSTAAKNAITLTMDIDSGALYTAQPYDSLFNNTDGLPGDSSNPSDKLAGFSYRQLTPKLKWEMPHNLNSSDVFVQCYNQDNNYIIPNSVQVVDNNNVVITFTEPMKGTAQLVVFLDPTIITMPDVHIPTYEYMQNIPSMVWDIAHDLGYLPITRVFVDGLLVIPYSITHVSVNRTIVTFKVPRTGTVRFI